VAAAPLASASPQFGRRVNIECDESRVDAVPTLPRPVYFVCPELAEWARVIPPVQPFHAGLADTFVRALEQGSLALTWLVQTYLRLAARGHDVRLAPCFPDDQSVCVYLSPVASRWGLANTHQVKVLAQELPELTQAQTGYGSFRVALCLDRPPAASAHVRVFQNPVVAEQFGAEFVPHWPQPGIVPRDPARGERFEHIVFAGISHNLDPEVQSDAFRQELACAGLTLDVRHAQGWQDYSGCDAVLAIRSRAVPEMMLRLKPASKLVSAWQAGVPAVLGVEPAFRVLRTSPLDYLEARDARDALAQLRVLRADPALVRAMRDQGRRRLREVDELSVVQAWEALLCGPVEDAYQRWSKRRVPRPFRALGYCVGLGRELDQALRFWRRYEHEQRALSADFRPS